MPRARLSVVIPVYNEGDNIASVLTRLLSAVYADQVEVLVVYDFDEDTTVPVVRSLAPGMPQVRLHRNTRGRGALNAVRSGLDAATAPYVLVTMADGCDDPADVDAMLARAEAGVDLVAGSRYMPGGRQIGGPPLKRTLSRLAGLSLHWIGGLPVRDPTNNYKLYSRRLLDEIDIQSQAGFELGLEMTVKAHLAGMRLAEVPTTWYDRNAGPSRFQLLAWLPHYLRWYRLGIVARLSASRRRMVASIPDPAGPPRGLASPRARLDRTQDRVGVKESRG